MKKKLADHDLSRLPAWARQRIELAERDRDALREEKRRRAKNVRTKTSALDYSEITKGLIEHYIDDHWPIRFRINSREHIDVRWMQGQKAVSISCGFGRLAIKAHSANLIVVECEL